MWTRSHPACLFPLCLCSVNNYKKERERDKEHSRKLSPSAVAHRSRPVSVLVTFKFTSRPSTIHARRRCCCWQSAPPVLLQLPGQNIKVKNNVLLYGIYSKQTDGTWPSYSVRNSASSDRNFHTYGIQFFDFWSTSNSYCWGKKNGSGWVELRDRSQDFADFLCP